MPPPAWLTFVEVQDVAGKTIGLIVLVHIPFGAWQAAYDALRLCQIRLRLQPAKVENLEGPLLIISSMFRRRAWIHICLRGHIGHNRRSYGVGFR